VTDPRGPAAGLDRMIAAAVGAAMGRTVGRAYRGTADPGTWINIIGLRVCPGPS